MFFLDFLDFNFLDLFVDFSLVFLNAELLGGGGMVKARRGGWLDTFLLFVIYTHNTYFLDFLDLFVDFFPYFLM